MAARRVWGQDEKLKIVLEGLRSANVAETCRKYELKLSLYHVWKAQVLEGARAGLGDKRHRGYRDPLTEEVRHLRELVGKQALMLELQKKLLGET